MLAAIFSPGIASAGIASEFSPLVEVLDPATVVFDVSGLVRLMGSFAAIARAIALRSGPRANVAIAANRNAAVHAARGFQGITVVPEGGEPALLGALPVGLLDTSPEILGILHRWGIHTFAQLAALPEIGLAERLGAEGLRLRRLALGRGDVPLKPEAPPAAYRASVDLDHPIALLEPLSFVLSRLLNQVCLQLAAEGLAALEIGVLLGLESRARHERSLRLPVPMRDPVAFLKLLMLDLDARPPAAAVLSVAIEMEAASPRAVQVGLFTPPTPEPEKLELTLRRIAAIVGDENVGTPELVDTHRPGAFRTAQAFEKPRALLEVPKGTLAFRLFRPAEQARVTPEAGPPAEIWSHKAKGTVLTAAGPWRTSGDWWTQSPWARDDWDVALSDGALYRVYREYFSGRWYLDGRYD